jgi:hypothetical protein
VRYTLVLSALVALVAAGAAGTAPRADACKPGIRKIGTASYRVYCGPASASLRVGRKTQSFRKGACVTLGGKVFTLSIGALTISKGKPRYRYLNVTVPQAKRDGTYRRASVTWTFGTKRYLLSPARVRLAGKRSRGTFSGRIAGTNRRVAGSFHCK